MKYAVMICGGLSDRPMPEHDNITPLSSVRTPSMDKLAARSETGLVKTTAITEQPSPAKAVLSVLGYDPKQYFKGRAVLYAAEAGIAVASDDVIFQCSPVKLSDDEVYEEKIMLSDCPDMSGEETEAIFHIVSETLGNDIFRFVKKNDRIFLIWKQGEPLAGTFFPPHKAVGRSVGQYLPKGDFVQPLYDIMRKSSEILKDKALWLWGISAYPKIISFRDRWHLNGSIMTDVDFARGIGKLAGMEVLSCEGNISRNIMKAFADGQDIVFVYTNDLYACGLNGELRQKAAAIEKFDKDIVKPLTENLRHSGEDFGMMILSDLAVSVYLKRLANDPVPYLIYKSNEEKSNAISSFNENTAADSPYYIAKPYELLNRLISRP